MSSARGWLWIVAGLGATALGGARPLRAESILCTPIPSVPYTIQSRGVYCLDRDLIRSFGQRADAAITVNADHVVVDLNGFTLGAFPGATDPEELPPPGVTLAVGIHALNRSHVTVKNGTIRGFHRAVHLEGMGSTAQVVQGHLVEDVNADDNVHAGIVVDGSGSIVRRNRVLRTGGGPGMFKNHGIRVNGPRPQVMDNEVTETQGGSEGGESQGISVDASGAVVEGNRIGNGGPSSGVSFGIVLLGPDALVVGNRLSLLDQGIFFSPEASGKYRDNLASGVAAPYQGGTDAGNNQ
jgi:hypothetical protein